MLKRISFIYLLTSCALVNATVLLWDFGGVLFDPDKLGVAREIGLTNFISYMIHDRKNPNVQKLIFKVLDTMEAKHNDALERAGTAEGMPLPRIMCDWQAGTITGLDIIKKARGHLAKLSKAGYFSSDREKNLVKRTINAMFNPEILARNIKLMPKGLELIKECASARNPDGSKKHINIGFSNWDGLSFQKFYKDNLPAFKYFDHVLISADIKLIKPHKEAYDYILNKYNLEPSNCIIIDDQQVNTKGAKTTGIKAIQLRNKDFKSLRKKLINLGIL